MTIRVIEEPVLELTREEYDRYNQEYANTFMHYSGHRPSFEEWVRRKKATAVNEGKQLLNE